MTEQQTVLSWLKDAHAMEVGAFPTLEDHASAAEAYPEMQGKLREHLEQTRRHAELIAGCLERLGGQPAAFKETVSSALGKVTGIANLPAKDTTVKNALGDYAAENFEIACYTSLVAGAERLGDAETADVCRQILQEEEEMAGWLEGYIPTLTERYLAGVADMPDVQENLKQTVQDLSDKGKEAASNVDAKNTLLASGAILAGAGAALLVGQALRGRSGNNQNTDQSRAADQTNLQTDTQNYTQSLSTENSLVGDTLVGDMSVGDVPTDGIATENAYDGYVSEVEVGSAADAPLADSLLEPEPLTTDALSQNDPYQDELGAIEDVPVEDVWVEEVYTEAWLLPGPYTGVGPKSGVGAGDATGQEVYLRLTQHGQIDASTVEVTVDDGDVLLEGTVDSEETKRAVEDVVKSVPGATNVQNSLQVSKAQVAKLQDSESQVSEMQGENDMSQDKQEFDHSTTIDASPDEVYAFMSQVENLPKYLPTTHAAQPQEGERVRVQGEAQGHKYDADGFFRKDEANHRIEWGADEQYYSGHLEVTGQGDGSTMSVHLSFSGGPPAGEGDAPNDDSSSEAPNREQIQEGLVKALESIKNFVEEGRSGGKEEPSAAT